MTEDRDILSRLGADYIEPSNNQEGTRVPVHVDIDPAATGGTAIDSASRESQEGYNAAKAYSEIYYSADSDMAAQRKHAETIAHSGINLRFATENWRPRSYAVAGLTDDERLWAALAHVSSVLTIGAAIATDGWAIPLMVFAPLAIYFAFREKSDFVTFHALQAFAMQIIGTVGWIALLSVGASVLAAGIAVSALASIVLIGIPFLIVLVIVLIVFVLFCVLLPFALLLLSLAGSYKTYTGKDYRYPYISLWIERQLSGGAISV